MNLVEKIKQLKLQFEAIQTFFQNCAKESVINHRNITPENYQKLKDDFSSWAKAHRALSLTFAGDILDLAQSPEWCAVVDLEHRALVLDWFIQKYINEYQPVVDFKILVLPVSDIGFVAKECATTYQFEPAPEKFETNLLASLKHKGRCRVCFSGVRDSFNLSHILNTDLCARIESTVYGHTVVTNPIRDLCPDEIWLYGTTGPNNTSYPVGRFHSPAPK